MCPCKWSARRCAHASGQPVGVPIAHSLGQVRFAHLPSVVPNGVSAPKPLHMCGPLMCPCKAIDVPMHDVRPLMWPCKCSVCGGAPLRASLPPYCHSCAACRCAHAIGEAVDVPMQEVRPSMCPCKCSARGGAHCAIPRAGSLCSPALGRAQWRPCSQAFTAVQPVDVPMQPMQMGRPSMCPCKRSGRRCAHANVQPMGVPIAHSLRQVRFAHLPMVVPNGVSAPLLSQL